MTDREALDRLLSCGEDCLDCMTCVAHDEALAVAVGALRERLDRDEGCEWCNGIGKAPENWECSLVGEYGTVTTVDHEVIWTTATFCPVCGRKLKGAQDAVYEF